MVTDFELAELIFPEVKETIEDLEKRYPERNLPEGAQVTRFAPSPTGFLHTGSLFTSLICHQFANQTKGIFYVRLEDTDTKREIEGSGEQLISQLKAFNIVPDEGYFGDEEKGNYGPYVQSKRADIYKVVIKHLLKQGLAYPCFCTQKDIDDMREIQEKMKIVPGYYGNYAKCRVLSNDEKAELIKSGKPYVIRFKSFGDHNRKIKVNDLIRGSFNIAENDQDIVIYKSDGLPTYHFAHLCDDHFMRTTTVIRGEEWIASLPIHLQLFETLGWKAPNYAHVPTIMKIDEETNTKRKLSKRKDKEAACSFFIENGYPVESLPMYLLTIANSNFEEWIFEHNFQNMNDFNLSFDKFSSDGALFDVVKLQFFAKEILARKTKEEMLELGKEYASKYDPKLYDLILRDENMFMNIMNIERDTPKPRKDYYKFGGMEEIISFFYRDHYLEEYKGDYKETLDKETIKNVLSNLKDSMAYGVEQNMWFDSLKLVAEKNGFAINNKDYKANPEAYKGNTADVAEILRIAVTARRNSPNLYYVIYLLGKDEVNFRIDNAISSL